MNLHSTAAKTRALLQAAPKLDYFGDGHEVGHARRFSQPALSVKNQASGLQASASPVTTVTKRKRRRVAGLAKYQVSLAKQATDEKSAALSK